MKRYLGGIIICFIVSATSAQITQDAAKQLKIYEDDDFFNIWGQGTDRGYSNGTGIGYLFMKEKKSVFLDKWILPVARGWEHQVPNAPLVNYNFTYEAMLWKPGRLLEIIGGATGKAGTMTTSAGAFTYIRAGFFNPYFGNRNLPVAARRRFQFYINPTGPGYKCRGVSISAFCFIFAP